MSNSLPTSYQQYIHKSRYARFIEEEKRRESWTETVSRYINFISNHLKSKHKHIIPNKGELEEAIIKTLLEVAEGVICNSKSNTSTKVELVVANPVVDS